MENRPEDHETKRINIHKSWDVNFWCEELNLRAEELQEIVKKVGPEIHDVRVYLAKKLLSSWAAVY